MTLLLLLLASISSIFGTPTSDPQRSFVGYSLYFPPKRYLNDKPIEAWADITTTASGVETRCLANRYAQIPPSKNELARAFNSTLILQWPDSCRFWGDMEVRIRLNIPTGQSFVGWESAITVPPMKLESCPCTSAPQSSECVIPMRTDSPIPVFGCIAKIEATPKKAT